MRRRSSAGVSVRLCDSRNTVTAL